MRAEVICQAVFAAEAFDETAASLIEDAKDDARSSSREIQPPMIAASRGKEESCFFEDALEVC